jgi:hypothetical protein
MMDALSILALAKQCAAAAPAVIVAAIGLVETGGNPYAVSVSGNAVQTLTLAKAVQAASAGKASGEPAAVGLTLISETTLKARGLTLTDGLSACTNLRVTAELVREQLELFKGNDKDADWRRAAIAFGTGHPDAAEVNDYGARFDRAHQDIEAALPLLGPSAQERLKPAGAAAQSQTNKLTEATQAEAVTDAPPHWDVFGRGQSRPLRFSE